MIATVLKIPASHVTGSGLECGLFLLAMCSKKAQVTDDYHSQNMLVLRFQASLLSVPNCCTCSESESEDGRCLPVWSPSLCLSNKQQIMQSNT